MDIKYIAVILAVFSVAVLIRHMMLKRQIRSISRQMDGVIAGETEKNLDISLIDRDLEYLAGQINQYCDRQRTVAAGALKNEENLKESVANISHDLRTPLTVIMGHLQMLIKSELMPEQKRRAETALHKSSRMKELLEAFYDLSVLEANQGSPCFEKINFSNFVMEYLAENAPLFESRHIHPQVHLPSVSAHVTADRQMLGRILENLLANAVRYTAGDICIILEPLPEGRVAFQVENTLPDGEEIEVRRLFERFYTGDRSRHNGSTGLGLSVVKILTEKMNGTVEAEVREDRLSVRIVMKN